MKRTKNQTPNQQVRVTYHGRDWFSFHTDALMYLRDQGIQVNDVAGDGLRGYRIFHYQNATVTLGTCYDAGKMCAGLEFIAQRDADKTAEEFLRVVKANPSCYRIKDVTNNTKK